MHLKSKRIFIAIVPMLVFASPLYAFDFGATPAEARRHILEYAREYPASSRHSAARRRFVRQTILRALEGNFRALNLVLTDERFGSGDNTASLPVGGEFLGALGDKRYAAYVLSHPMASRWKFLDLVGPFGRSEEELRAGFPIVAKLYAEFYVPRER